MVAPSITMVAGGNLTSGIGIQTVESGWMALLASDASHMSKCVIF